MQRAFRRMTFELMLEIVELVTDRAPLRTEHLLHVRGHIILVAQHRDRRNVPNHRCEHNTDAGIAVGCDDDVSALVIERNKPQHVLHRRDARSEVTSIAPTKVRARNSSLLRLAPIGSV